MAPTCSCRTRPSASRGSSLAIREKERGVPPPTGSTNPLRPTTPARAPVLARSRPATGVPWKRLARVPSRAATGNPPATGPDGPPRASAAIRREQLARSERSRPEPSTVVRSPTGRPIPASASRTTGRPAAVVPLPPARHPSSLTSSSAVRLSLSRSIWPTTSVMGGDSTLATAGAPAGATPSDGGAATATPRAWSRAVKTAAACTSGSGDATWRGANSAKPSLTTSELAGPDSASVM